MRIDTNTMIPMTEANRNFSKVARMVDEKGSAVILKNNRPRYLIVNFDTLEDGTAGDEEVEAISKKLMQQNRTAYDTIRK
ncbi:type II toxin-antitoxin system Phd/YefM family antitoxin [uncultured Dialister sp.]|uniref:type II toxin-antitoxin system Phd/YefM family antitoxin n=1 Tax=uncultured Dialister sp. TaxID=278064 RepID=UPI0025F9145A|nr:type II toxin-antitoxin system Phd/YefM family antitoxin [uncultured Dialister sp.]